MFNCRKMQIKKIMKNKEAILKELQDIKLCGVKRNLKEKFRDVNNALDE